MKATALSLSLLALLLASPAGARENPLLGQYAKSRMRGQNGRFLPVKAEDRAIRRPLVGTGWANPSSTGQSEAKITVTPATSKRAGKLEVTIPEHYSGTSYQGRVSQRQLFGTDIRGKTAVVDGTLTVKRHSPYSSFGPASYEGRIRPGTTISTNGLKDILRGLFVNPYSLKLSPAK